MTEPATDADASDSEVGVAELEPPRAAALESYLSEELGVAVTDTEVLADGLNLNVAVETAEDDWYVLRRPNKLRDAHYINDLEREYGTLQRLRGTAIPTPDPVLFCDDESVVGDRFLVVTRLDGAVVPLGSGLPDRFRNADSHRRVADRLVDTLAEVHSVDVAPFEGVCERRTPRGSRSLSRPTDSTRRRARRNTTSRRSAPSRSGSGRTPRRRRRPPSSTGTSGRGTCCSRGRTVRRSPASSTGRRRSPATR